MKNYIALAFWLASAMYLLPNSWQYPIVSLHSFILGLIMLKSKHSQLMIIGLFVLMTTFFNNLPYNTYAILFSIFSGWSFISYYRPNIGYLPYNHTNVCIAFYRGSNKSLKARLSSLFGLEVTSVDLLINGSIWRYKRGELIKIQECHSLDEYIMFDTGIKPDEKILSIIDKISKTKYNSLWYTANCTMILLPLLEELKIAPKNYFETIPSIYLRKLLNGTR
jgi:hypothetical protein